MKGKPVIADECGYERNLQQRWGNRSAEEMTDRIRESLPAADMRAMARPTSIPMTRSGGPKALRIRAMVKARKC